MSVWLAGLINEFHIPVKKSVHENQSNFLYLLQLGTGGFEAVVVQSV
jgi:hypothetical protein